MALEDIINMYGLVDYYEMSTGRTFLIGDWGRAWKLFGMNLPINVVQDGEIIGTANIDTTLLKEGVA